VNSINGRYGRDSQEEDPVAARVHAPSQRSDELSRAERKGRQERRPELADDLPAVLRHDKHHAIDLAVTTLELQASLKGLHIVEPGLGVDPE
jgi:hypothetical protein